MAKNISQKLKIACSDCGQKLDVTDLTPFSIIHCPTCNCKLTIPRLFGTFLLWELVEHGPVASVYKAVDMKLDRESAVKIFEKSIIGNSEYFDHFKSITRQNALLNAPNILPVYSSGEQDGYPYLATEFMPRFSLHNEVVKNGKLSPLTALFVVEQAARGLDAAYAEGVEHGCLHPHNILLGLENEVKISDFQMHKLTVDAGAETKGATPPRMDVRYASPELQQQGKQDFRGDIFSLGAILAFALSAEQPLALEKDENGTRFPGMIDFLNSNVSKKTSILFECMTRISPTERPQSYRAVIAMIADVKAELKSPAKKIIAAGAKTKELLNKNGAKKQSSKLVGPVIFFLLFIVLLLLAFGCWQFCTRERADVEGLPHVTKTTAPMNETEADKGARSKPIHQQQPKSSTIGDGGGHLQPAIDSRAEINNISSIDRRPQPADLDFYKARKEVVEYVNNLPADIREHERDRIRKLSLIRPHLQKIMRYIPFSPEDGYIELANGRRVRGNIPFCNDNELTVSLNRRSTSFRSVKWNELSIGQYAEMLIFYAEQRLTADKESLSAGLDALDFFNAEQRVTADTEKLNRELNISPRKDAAREYLLAALLLHWYGQPQQIKSIRAEAVKLDPKIADDFNLFLSN